MNLPLARERSLLVCLLAAPALSMACSSRIEPKQGPNDPAPDDAQSSDAQSADAVQNDDVGAGGSQNTDSAVGAEREDAATPEDTSPAVGKCDGLAAGPSDDKVVVEWGGKTRTAFVHVPKLYDAKSRTPLVLNFHGFSSNALQQAFFSKMNAKSDGAGFLVVYPEGTGILQSWNAGACCGDAARDKLDDVGYVGALVDALEAKYCVDRRRIFATGMSNGGFLSHRLACEMSNRIAAVAPVAGVLGVDTCKPSRPASVIHFHGTSDAIVPYKGNPSVKFQAVQDTFDGWAKRDGCTGEAKETFSKGDARCQTFSKCDGGAEVTLCTIDGGGHTWPGGTPIFFLGKTSSDLSANDEMWSFFQRHPLP